MSSVSDLPLDSEKLYQLLTSNNNPVVISFLNPEGRLIATPVWTYHNPGDNLFYLFSSKKAVKVRTIEVGNKEFTLTIVNKDHFVVVEEAKIPYLSMTGLMEIITKDDVENINEIHIKLLEKYNIEGQQGWVSDIIARLRTDPDDTWMLRFTPERFGYYRH